MFELDNSSRPSSSPNFKTKIGFEKGLENYAMIIARILPGVVCKNGSDESICFITCLCYIYKWEAIGMLRGRLKMEFSHVYFSLALESKEIIRSF